MLWVYACPMIGAGPHPVHWSLPQTHFGAGRGRGRLRPEGLWAKFEIQSSPTTSAFSRWGVCGTLGAVSDLEAGVLGRGGYNSDDITRVGVGGGALSREAVMTE